MVLKGIRAPFQMLGLFSRICWEGACNSNHSPFPRTPETWLLIQAQPPAYWEF